MIKILVVLVGHTSTKLDRLIKLYTDKKPNISHEVITVYNGKGNYSSTFCCKNDKNGRDVAMYAEAVGLVDADFYFFMNDDICYIKDKYWLENAVALKTEVIGVQTNLASIVSHKLIKKINGRLAPKHIEQGTKPRFIRTSSFGCTKDYFLRVWKYAEGSAQRFEKATLKLAKNYALFTDSWYIYDENLKAYAKEIKNG